MDNQAQVNAIEHLLMAVLKTAQFPVDVQRAFDSAYGSLLGSDGPGGPNQKSDAVHYLNCLKQQFR
jgi:hypothetical protein